MIRRMIEVRRPKHRGCYDGHNMEQHDWKNKRQGNVTKFKCKKCGCKIHVIDERN